MSFRVLIVDDKIENHKALSESLSDTDIEIVSASSGIEALQRLSENSQFGLALLDVQMPEMDGFELASLMRGVEKTKYIPIIFITANHYSAGNEYYGYDLGAVDFIFKPINIQVLKAKVDVFKKLHEKRAELDQKILELEEAKSLLEVSKEQAVESDRTKSNFLANMSHEIRTPITALIGFAELLRKGNADQDTTREYLDIIVRSGKHLIQLVNEILDISKVEAGQLTLEYNSVNLQQSINDMMSLIEPLARKNAVQVNLHISEDLPEWIKTDPLRFRQIFTNLVSNAVKFSPKGAVDIQLAKLEKKQLGTDAVKAFLKIVVKDNGLGIPLAKQDKLFLPFSQISNSLSSTTAGTGLGLYLSKQLAHALDGNLGLVESQQGQGSTFYFEIPLHPMENNFFQYEKKSEKSIHTESLKGLDILIVDDSVDNQMLIEAMLGQYGANTNLASHGDEALDIVRERSFDLILMDYRMPGRDGLSTTHEIRQRGVDIPIILLTANAMKGEKEKGLAIGANAYISKPIDWNHLVGSIVELTQR